MKIKNESNNNPRYLTKGKIYQAMFTHLDLVGILDDDGDEITVRLTDCAFLSGDRWIVVEEGETQP